MATFGAAGISVAFGGVQATSDVSFEAEPGQILGIIGPNGSGKTTLLNALTGLVPAQGRAWLGDEQLDLRRPAKIRRLGVLRLFQAPQAIPELTVAENVMLSTSLRRRTGFAGALLDRRGMLAAERARRTSALSALATVGIEHLADQHASRLTYGQRRLLDLARALAADPKVIMLDEPSAGLNQTETARLAQLLQELSDDDRALVVVDHKVDFLNSLCDLVLAMHQGERIALAEPAAVWADPRVIESYLGHAHA